MRLLYLFRYLVLLFHLDYTLLYAILHIYKRFIHFHRDLEPITIDVIIYFYNQTIPIDVIMNYWAYLTILKNSVGFKKSTEFLKSTVDFRRSTEFFFKYSVENSVKRLIVEKNNWIFYWILKIQLKIQKKQKFSTHSEWP